MARLVTDHHPMAVTYKSRLCCLAISGSFGLCRPNFVATAIFYCYLCLTFFLTFMFKLVWLLLKTVAKRDCCDSFTYLLALYIVIMIYNSYFSFWRIGLVTFVSSFRILGRSQWSYLLWWIWWIKFVLFLNLFLPWIRPLPFERH